MQGFSFFDVIGIIHGEQTSTLIRANGDAVEENTMTKREEGPVGLHEFIENGS